MIRLLLRNAKVIIEKEVIEHGYVYIENDKIKSFGTLANLPSLQEEVQVIHLSDEDTIAPGFIDVHIHGVGGADTMDGTMDALSTMATTLPAEGTTSFLATTITQGEESISTALKNVANYCNAANSPGKAEILGVHLEGPFINVKKAGAQPKNEITAPNINLFKKWQEEADGLIKLVTLAPEVENGIELIEYLSSTQVISSIGHSDATYEQVERAVEAGASHVTHLFNGMRGIHHREPGVAGSALLFKELIIEMIVDGIHIDPQIVRLALQSKGVDGTILVTDSMRAKCLKSGEYELGGQPVTVKDGKALLSDGTLAGSILKMKQAVQNIVDYTNISLVEAIQLVTVNPAKQLNIYDRKGSIEIGKDADLVVLNKELDVTLTLCRGIKAYEKELIKDENY
ncbi:N-acetylglucosamine-6-phosphate deacetylase [Cytobacillus sp. FJAT-54145]|uniref:N-acetylglucosamine-6-phosphate deacetylase n=1 Tax=Cytobacillus spartinae TaxID=3299023 RepID=A0ABW6KBN0_9BACI